GEYPASQCFPAAGIPAGRSMSCSRAIPRIVIMKQSQLFGATLRVAPGQSESAGHQMLQRAAMVRQVAQGIFAYLPFGWRAVRKIEELVRSEMEAICAEELSMPVVNPADIWKQSGRYYKIGPELARLRDRRDRDMVLALTHEEVVTGQA